MTRERLGSIYRTLALLFLNSFLLLVLLELLSGLVLDYRLSRGMQAWAGLDYYQNQPWGQQYWREARFIFEGNPVDYHPYVLWRRSPFSGETIQVNQEGIRPTPGSECVPGAYTLFVFGGSAMWGFGAPDWATIPALLQEALTADRSRPVCIISYAEPAFVSTQSLIQLEIALQRGGRPDAVVFLEGANDVIAAYQTGQAGGHHNQARIAQKLETEPRPLVNALQSSRIFELLRVLVSTRVQRDYVDLGAEAGPLGEQVAGVYLENIKIVQSMADRYGFRSYFFWQPVLPAGDKALTAEEAAMLASMDSAEIELFLETDEAIAAQAAGQPDLSLLSHVFDEQATAIWIDPLHFTPEGNRIVAQEILLALGAE